MKQIERSGSAQRVTCELLERDGPMTIKRLSEERRVHARAIARQLDALIKDGYVSRERYPRLYSRTSKPLPPVVSSTPPRSEAVARVRRRDREALRPILRIPSFGDLERVMSSWARL